MNESELVAMKGNVPISAQARYDRGEAAASMRLTHIRVVLSRSPEQQAALDKFLAELQDKSSPNYHKWLTPEQFGKLYGPADSDLAAVEGWLESHGLKLEEVSSGRTNIAFSGTVSQVEEALHVSIHSFEANGEPFYSNTAEPKIPAALASVVKGFAHLNTIKPRSHFVPGRSGQINPETHRLEPMSTQRGLPNLTLGAGTGSNPYFLMIVPGDAATIYDTPNTFNANFTSGQMYTGQGVTIGIVGDALIRTSTVSAYRSTFMGSSAVPTITNVDGVSLMTNPGDQGEAYLDTEISGALAPDAALHFYTSTDLSSAINRAVNDGTVDILSLSFGYCELGLSSGDNQQLYSWWEQAEGQGIAVTVSTGDTGSAGCDPQEDNNGHPITAAEYGLAVSGYASTSHNIAVGGTDLDGLNSSFTSYVSTSQGSASAYFRTAMKYIPESAWNNSAASVGFMAQNVPWTAYPLPDSENANISAGSGGASSCSTNTTIDTQTTYSVGTCTSGYPKPAWQRGIGVPSDKARDIPDVSLMSGNGFDSATWLVCDDNTTSSESGTLTVPKNCQAQPDGYTYFDGVGGTSAAAPAFAGILALVQQKTGGRLGQAAVELYDLYNGSHAGSVFHDVTTGNNAVPCTNGTPNCAKNAAGYYFETGYDTTAGYDLATGLGSVDATQLIDYWGTGVGTATATLTVTPSSSSVKITDAFTVSVTVGGSGSVGTPTGTVTLSGGGYTSPAEQLSQGSYTFSIAAWQMAVGADVLTVSYSGDSNYSVANNSASSIQVSGLTPTVTVTPASSSVYSGAALSVTVAVSGVKGSATPTGTVTLSGGGYSSGAQQLSSGSYSFTVPANTFLTSPIVLNAVYNGDATYAAATGASSQIAVIPSTFTLTAQQSGISFKAGATSGNTMSVTVQSTTGYAGAVTLTASISPTGAAAPVVSVSGSPVTLSATQTSGTATVTASTTAASAMLARPLRRGTAGWYEAAGGAMFASLLLFFLPGGARRWRTMLGALMLLAAVSFAGAGCGCGGSGSGGGGTSKTTPTVTVTPSKTAISVTDPLTVAVAVTGSGSTPTGTVTLSGGGYSGNAQTLSSGGASFSIPASTFAAGNVTLTASYSGDSNYNSNSGSSAITVNSVATTAGTYTVTVTGTGSDAARTTASTTFTVTVQ